MSFNKARSNYAFVVSLIFLSGCGGNYPYKPAIYPLAQDRIQNFELKGTLELKNIQASVELQESTNSGMTHNYTYKDVTDGFNQQFYREVSKHAQVSDEKGSKSLKTSISHFLCETRGFNTWVYRCEIAGEVETAEGVKIAINYEHGAPVVAGIQAALDGMTAIAVEKTLESPVMLNYLKK